MPAAINIINVDDSGSVLHVYGTITLTGNYPSGGDPLDFTAIIGKGALNRTFQAGKGPTWFSAQGTTGDDYGFIKEPAPAVANAFGLKTGKLTSYTTSGSQLGAGAYSAGQLADLNIYFEAVFDLNL